MIWFLYAFLTAIFQSLKDVFGKKGLKQIDVYIIAWAWKFLVFLFLLPLLLFFEIPTLNNKFWIALAVGGSVNLVATILYLKAIKISDLSICIPMITFTPLFLLLTSPLIVGEFPTFYGLIGIILIVLGAYTLNISKRNNGYLAPIKALLKEQGPRLMLFVAFIWSISANFDKVGVLNSSPIFWAISLNLFLALTLFPFVMFKSQNKVSHLTKHLNFLVPMGLFSAASMVCQMVAITLTLVAYVIAIKRTSAIISVVFGWLIFKEKGIKERLLGATIMVIGVLFITLF